MTEPVYTYDWEKLPDDELLSAYHEEDNRRRWAAENIGHIEMILKQRLEERGASEIPHPDLVVKLESRHAGYDLSRIQALKELLPPAVIAEAYTPAHEEVVQVPDRWDGRQLLGWPKRFGKEVAVILEAAELPRTVRLVIKPKEAKL